MEQSKPGKGKEENGERERLSSFLLMWPGSLEINLLELMTAQIQLTEEPVHFGAAWHLPELREGEEVVLPPPSHTGSVQHCTAQHMSSFSKTAVTTLVSTSHAQPVRMGNCKYWDLERYKQH